MKKLSLFALIGLIAATTQVGAYGYHHHRHSGWGPYLGGVATGALVTGLATRHPKPDSYYESRDEARQRSEQRREIKNQIRDEQKTIRDHKRNLRDLERKLDKATSETERKHYQKQIDHLQKKIDEGEGVIQDLKEDLRNII